MSRDYFNCTPSERDMLSALNKREELDVKRSQVVIGIRAELSALMQQGMTFETLSKSMNFTGSL
jgi:BMFP domain-containing protein YqiC